jgi:hypothetical protein
MNLGHAFRLAEGASIADEVEEVIRIAQGKTELAARVPLDSDAVKKAEAILGVQRGVVYTFAGCLHPGLGTIGLIITEGSGKRLLEGATRCDSGGLAGGRGGFADIDSGEVAEALLSLSYLREDAIDWHPAFGKELLTSYPKPDAYIGGEVPDYTTWTDRRVGCFKNYDPDKWPPDRRLWTWEIRLGGSPHPDEFVAVVFSHEAFKHVELLRMRNELIPNHLRVIVGDVSPGGVHYFSDPIVAEILSG